MVEQDISIDIHTSKLLEWLISRHHCKREWSENVVGIREKINNAIQDMPAHEELTTLLSGTYINYFHCLRIIELLKETEVGSKNIFGRYSSQRMKDWQEIVKLYEKDNIYLAEAAQMLIRNVNYEIPSMRKHITKCQLIQEECVKKEEECVTAAKNFRDKYFSSCLEMGIKGEDVKKELVDSLKTLNDNINTITSSAQQLKEAVKFYSAFINYVLSKSEEKPALPHLQYLISKGNTTVYEWRTGLKPLSIENENNIGLNQVEGGIGDVIDFGEDTNDVIDFGEDAVDFGGENNDVIDFGENVIIQRQNVEDMVEVEKKGYSSSDNVARGKDAESLLENADTRNEIVNELSELEAFLEQRLLEMNSSADFLSLDQFQSSLPLIQLQTLDSVTIMAGSLKEVLGLITMPKIQHLFLIKSSPRYVDRVEKSLKHQQYLAERLSKTQELLRDKRTKQIEEQSQLEPKLQLIIQKTKELQKQIEKEISTKYAGRVVNLIGGIANI